MGLRPVTYSKTCRESAVDTSAISIRSTGEQIKSKPPILIRKLLILLHGCFATRASLIAISFVIFIAIFASSCQLIGSRKSDIEIEFMLDTLDVGYTYWWPEAGPFIGNCGKELSLVFTGTLTNLEAPTSDAGPLYTPQKGTITIEEVFKIKELNGNTYKNQRFITTDCFYESGIGTGDKVLVICYDFENDYTIPGAGSILKIESFDDEGVASMRKYIDNDEDPVKIEKDIGLWATYGHGRALEQLIDCRSEMKDEEPVDTNSIQ